MPCKNLEAVNEAHRTLRSKAPSCATWRQSGMASDPSFFSAVQSVHPAADRRWCFLMGHRFFRLNYFRLLISWFQRCQEPVIRALVSRATIQAG
jgi:hypothetical protein